MTSERRRAAAGLLGLLSVSCSATDPSPALPPDSGPPSASAHPGPSAQPRRSGLGCVAGPGKDYEVGPGKPYAQIGDVPLERLGPGDTVRVHARAEPYHEKIMIGGSGAEGAPIKLCGIPDAQGARPIIDGRGATTRPSLDFPYDGHQPRALVIVGKKHGDPWQAQPRFIEIEGLEIRGARSGVPFTDKSGKPQRFSEIATGLYVQRGSHVVIRGNYIHDNGNGLFVGGGGGDELSEDILIEQNRIEDNGSPDRFYEHNIYNEANGVVYQYNQFGPPRGGAQGVLGGNIKERSAGVVIRYNRIEGGAHLIDLVEAQDARDRLLPLPGYRESWVYGNVLVRGPANGSMVHYGGDSGQVPTYRRGTLHFWNNTVLVDNRDHPAYAGTALFELSSDEEHLDARNNVFFSVEAPRPADRPVVLLGARDGLVAGRAELAGNWLRKGIAPIDGIPGKQPEVSAEVRGFEASARGDSSPFVDWQRGDLRLAPAIATGEPPPYPATAGPLLEPAAGLGRPASPRADKGALAGAFGR